MDNKKGWSKAFAETFKHACKYLGIKSSRLCCEMDMVMQEAAEQGQNELVLSEDTLKKYCYVGFSRVCYLDAYSEFIRIFVQAINRIKADSPALERNWEKHKDHILKSFDTIHDQAADHFTN